MTYVVDPTNTLTPADTDNILQGAEEFRTLKAYIATQLAALGGPVNNWNAKYKNLLLNPDFNLWTNGTAKDLDCWKLTTAVMAAPVTRTAFTLGQPDIPDEPAYYVTCTPAANSAIGAMATYEQRIEGVRTLAGKTATLTFYAKAASGTPSIGIEFVQSFGTGGTPSVDVNTIGVTTKVLSSAWVKYTVTVAIPSILTKTIGTSGGDYLSVLFWFTAGTTFSARSGGIGNQAIGISIAHVQLEEGGVSTAFEYRPLGTEQYLCSRYNQRYGGYTDACLAMGVGFSTVTGTTTSTITGIMHLDTPMLTVPNYLAIVGSAANFQAVGAAGTAHVASNVTLTAMSTKAIKITLTTTLVTAGQSYMITSVNTSALIDVIAAL